MALDSVEQLLKEITEANGVSGYEEEVRRIIMRELKGKVDRIEHDKMGSILGIKRGSSDRPRVLIGGHMDEVGFMVKEITKEGYIRFLPLGAWWGHVALGQRMRVITSRGPVTGVVGSRPPHLLAEEERKKVLDIKDMFIDLGVQEKFDVKKRLGVRVGDPIVPDSRFTVMGNRRMYLSKAFDNRVSCAIVVDLVKRFQKIRHPNTILAAASVQEEVGLRGAQTLAHAADPDVAIIVDVGVAQDMPPNPEDKAEKLGAGPCVLIYDAAMIPNIRLRDLVLRIADLKKIPHHLSYMERGATDGGRIHVSRAGVPSIVIGPPVRYIHSHNGILNRTDYDNTVKLIAELIRKLDRRTVDSLTEV